MPGGSIGWICGERGAGMATSRWEATPADRSASRVAVRRRGDEAYLRTCLALRLCRVREFARPDWPVHQDGGGVRAGAQRDLRQGPDGRHEHRRPAGLHGRARNRREGPAHRRGARLLELEGMAPEVSAATLAAAEKYAELGAEVGDVDSPPRNTACRRTTSSDLPRRRRTSLASTVSATATGSKTPRTCSTSTCAREPRVRSGVDTPHVARHLRAVRRLLRRVLRPGPEGAHRHHQRLRQGVRRLDVLLSPLRLRRPSRSARRRPTRSRCTSRTTTPSR